MSIIKAFSGALRGTFADQWKDIVTIDNFDEYVVVSPGILKQPQANRGTYNQATEGVISNGSKIFIPENTAAFIFNQSGIEDIITEPGGYEYQSGQSSVFNDESISNSIFKQTKERFGYGGQSVDFKKVAFVNLREIRGIKFGTRGSLMYHDLFYESDLEITAFGAFSIKIVDPLKFISNYVPANTNFYTFNDRNVRSQILSEFIQSFVVALNSLSSTFRISQLPSQSNNIVKTIAEDNSNAGTWSDRFGFEIVQIGLESIALSPESRELVNKYSSNRMDWKVYENVSQESSNIAAQQKIAKGVESHGLGDMPGMVLGMGIVNDITAGTETKKENKYNMSMDEQFEMLKKLKELLDAGILSQEEFDLKKKEILNS